MDLTKRLRDRRPLFVGYRPVTPQQRLNQSLIQRFLQQRQAAHQLISGARTEQRHVDMLVGKRILNGNLGDVESVTFLKLVKIAWAVSGRR